MDIGLWNNINLICGNHGDDYSNNMEMKEGPHSLFFSCPKYISVLEKRAGRSCNNRLTQDDYIRMCEKITKARWGEFGIKRNINGLEWEERGVYYKIIGEAPDGKLNVVMLNKKAIAS